MLAQQSTDVFRAVVTLFLVDYRKACADIPDATRRGAVMAVVNHQEGIISEMPAAALADLFLRAKRADHMIRSANSGDDEKFAKDLLEIV